jgi:hypothetical protein
VHLRKSDAHAAPSISPQVIFPMSPCCTIPAEAAANRCVLARQGLPV